MGNKESEVKFYVLYSSSRLKLEINSSHEQSYALQSYRTCYAVGDCVLGLEDGRYRVVVSAAVECSEAMDDSLRYPKCSMPNMMHLQGLNSQNYSWEPKGARRLGGGDRDYVRKIKASYGAINSYSESDESKESKVPAMTVKSVC